MDSFACSITAETEERVWTQEPETWQRHIEDAEGRKTNYHEWGFRI